MQGFSGTFVETLERACRQLTALGHPIDNPVLCQVVKTKIPNSVLMELVRYERESGRQWGMADLRRGLAELVAIRAEVQRISGPSNPQRFSGGGKNMENARVFAIGASGDNKNNPQGYKRDKDKKWDCIFCGEKHKSSQCPKCKTLREKREALAKQKRCWKILEHGTFCIKL